MMDCMMDSVQKLIGPTTPLSRVLGGVDANGERFDGSQAELLALLPYLLPDDEPDNGDAAVMTLVNGAFVFGSISLRPNRAQRRAAARRK